MKHNLRDEYMELTSPVRLRPDIQDLPTYRQGSPAPLDGFKLSSNESAEAPLAEVLAAVGRSASELNRYPDASAQILREKLAERFAVSSNEILIGAGSVALIAQFIQAAAGPGDEVLFSWRSFEAYPNLARLAGASPVAVANRQDHGHDFAALRSAVTDRTRVILICSPNNPTGVPVLKEEFEAFITTVPSDILVLLDEAYYEFVADHFALRGEDVLGRFPNVVVLRTFSKAYGLAGLRVGYAIGHESILNAGRTTAIPLSVTGVGVAAAMASLQEDTSAVLHARVRAAVDLREELTRTLRDDGWDVPASQGNFVWLAAKGQSVAIAEELGHAGIVVRTFPDEGVRISIGEPQALSLTVEALRTFIDRNRR